MSIKIEGGGNKENVFSDSDSGMPLWNGAPLLNLVYPVGSIYWSSNNTNPASLFGGTWTQIKDKFILAAGDSYTNGATGGAATVTLTVSNMPSHSHSFIPSGTVGSHTHTGPSHSHSFSGTTEEMNKNSSGTADLMGAELLRSKATGNMSVTRGLAGWGGGHNEEFPENVLLTINVQHTHSISGTTDEAGTGNTGETAPSFTGTAGANGSGSSFSILPPYVVKYCWERTA